MTTTVIAAFNEFQRDLVNLDAAETATARSSRDWLCDQISEFPGNDAGFPRLYPEHDIFFGSFARRTKIRPLDDIDMIICLHAAGASYLAYENDDVRITAPQSSSLYAYRHDSEGSLSSTRIVNKFVRTLGEVSHYQRAEINRRGEAATLKLASYDWNFDIVPAFMTAQDEHGRSYYLIPNGRGHWKKTDPRIDRDRVVRVNTAHEGNMLNVLRCVKYWQRRPTMVSMPRYLLEAIVVNYFEGRSVVASGYVDLELAAVFRYIATEVLRPVADPKRIQQDINSLDLDDRLSIQARALADANKVDLAMSMESANDMRGSINKWREIFGDKFPQYTGA